MFKIFKILQILNTEILNRMYETWTEIILIPVPCIFYCFVNEPTNAQLIDLNV